MWLFAFLSTFFGTIVGGTTARLLKRVQKKIDTTYAICAGLIFGLISIEIFPEAIKIGGWLISLVGVLLGWVLFKGLHSILHFNQANDYLSKEKRYIRTGLLLMLSIAIHNLPIGILIGTVMDSNLKMTLLQTLFVHSIPEGVILVASFMYTGIKPLNLLFLLLLVSLPVAIGVMIGNFISIEYQLISAFIMSFTIGILFTVTVTEILFASLEKSPAFKILVFTFLGFGLMWLFLTIT